MNMKTLKYLFMALILGCNILWMQAQNLALGIYPEPQEVVISSKLYTPHHGYVLRGIPNPDADAVKLMKESLPFALPGKKALPIEIKMITKAKVDLPQLGRSGSYILKIAKKGITIEIADDRSLFYAAQTLKQLVKYDHMGKPVLPICTITDYPDILLRGTVEGFYGDPWRHADRIEQIRFYGKMKLNTYIYGPKDDPYHSSEWRKPYPADQAQQIKDLVDEANHNKVNFVWAIHPGQDIKWDLTDSHNILSKFESMYDLGVRSFALFFDDIAGEGTIPEKQATLMNYIQKEFVNKKEDVQPLILCPTQYNRAMATTSYLDILGKQLDPSIQILWTGDQVVGDITKTGLEWIKNRLQRPVFVWWNFPVNDYCRDHLLMGPAYGLDTKIDSSVVTGFVANPMAWSEASKVALFSVGMFAWNTQSYDPERAWDYACRYIMPEAEIAFRIFCENNCDPGPNGHQYRRNESVQYMQAFESFLNGYKKDLFKESEANHLNSLFSQITVAPGMMYSQAKNKRMIEQINPWLMQFEFLGKAGTAVLHMANEWYEKDKAATWQRYLEVTAAMDSIKLISRNFNQNAYQSGVKTGSRVIMPFLNEIYRLTSFKLLSDPQAEETQVSKPSILTNIASFKNHPCIVNEDRIASAPLYEIMEMKPNEYIGLGWEVQKEAASFNFNLPLSNFQGRVFEWSADGKVWYPIQGISNEEVKKTITNIDPKAHYVRMRNNSDQTMQINILGFTVTTKEITEQNEELMMYDMNLSSYKVLEPNDIVEVKCGDINSISFFLSGDNSNLVSITGTDTNGEKQIIYQGNVGYIYLNQSVFDNIKTLEVKTIGEKPIRIHQIVRE